LRRQGKTAAIGGLSDASTLAIKPLSSRRGLAVVISIGWASVFAFVLHLVIAECIKIINDTLLTARNLARHE
jgi:hypothetical protein